MVGCALAATTTPRMVDNAAKQMNRLWRSDFAAQFVLLMAGTVAEDFELAGLICPVS
jgi:hypothetical protein